MGWGRVEPTDFIVFGWELSWVGLNLIGNIPLGCGRGRATFLVTLAREFPTARSPRCALGIAVDLAAACSSLSTRNHRRQEPCGLAVRGPSDSASSAFARLQGALLFQRMKLWEASGAPMDEALGGELQWWWGPSKRRQHGA